MVTHRLGVYLYANTLLKIELIVVKSNARIVTIEKQIISFISRYILLFFTSLKIILRIQCIASYQGFIYPLKMCIK